MTGSVILSIKSQFLTVLNNCLTFARLCLSILSQLKTTKVVYAAKLSLITFLAPSNKSKSKFKPMKGV